MEWIITFFNYSKGWGFAERDGDKVFFHVKNSPGFHPELGMAVEFDYAPPFKLGQRDQAVNLRPASDAVGSGVAEAFAQKASGTAATPKAGA